MVRIIYLCSICGRFFRPEEDSDGNLTTIYCTKEEILAFKLAYGDDLYSMDCCVGCRDKPSTARRLDL